MKHKLNMIWGELYNTDKSLEEDCKQTWVTSVSAPR